MSTKHRDEREKTGIAVISIDFEFAWGYADQDFSEDDIARIRGEVRITERLLDLFEKYRIPATWAIVSRLLDQDPEKPNSIEWVDQRQLIQKIQEAPVGHEIGSHSHAHIQYGSSSKDDVEHDLASARHVHAAQKLSFRSFIFPRNDEGHHECLVSAGIKQYRGKTSHWWDRFPLPIRRIAHLFSYLVPVAPTHHVSRHSSGLVNIPDSLLLLGRNGLRRLIPRWAMIAKARHGIARAIRRGEVFHLWFHPSNFSYDTETQFIIFETILQHMSMMQERGYLRVLTMDQCVSDTL